MPFAPLYGVEGFLFEAKIMKEQFEALLKRMSPTIRRISYRLNGHFTFFDEDDLFQEALEHLWKAYTDGSLEDKTDSYILQGCYFHLKNYIRKAVDRASVLSLNKLISEEGSSIEKFLGKEDNSSEERLSINSIFIDRAAGITKREKSIIDLSLKGLTTRQIGARLGISHVMVIKVRKKIRHRYRNIRNSLRPGYQN